MPNDLKQVRICVSHVQAHCLLILVLRRDGYYLCRLSARNYVINITKDVNHFPVATAAATLKQYIMGFDQARLAETARVVSLEGVVLAERQTGALFGSIELLAKEMQGAIENAGQGQITSAEDLMRVVEKVVGENKVQTVTLPVSAQRRVVLEAVAFGSFLRDAENFVDQRDGRLLTPAPRAQPPPGMIGGGGERGGQ